jgi:cytochrome P450
MLLAARDENGAPMDRAQMRDEAITIFLAGHETTAIALSWTWYLLALHPEVEGKVHEEVRSVAPGRDPLPTDVPKFTYIRDVIAESMRLYPPVWNIVRRALRDTTLGLWRIPKDANVMASPLVTHRNPAFWREPRTFLPDRWSNDTRDLPKFAYFPFGGGNRVCIGESFAWTEAILVLATIARRWRLELVDPAPIPIEPMVTLRPARPILMRARRREHARA